MKIKSSIKRCNSTVSSELLWIGNVTTFRYMLITACSLVAGLGFGGVGIRFSV